MNPSAPSPPAVLFVGAGNYLHRARMLADCIHRFHPDWPVFLCRVDGPPEEPANGEPFHLLHAPWLEGPEGALAKFQYIAVELCGMSRPRAILDLFNRGHNRVLYLDLDISLHAPLTPLLEALEKHSLVLTPHLLAPSTREKPETKESIFRLTGLVNSGCMALRDHPQSRSFLQWWAARTQRHGHRDLTGGFFNEQAWVDYALPFYEEATLLRHPGVNVAWWNLRERPLSRRDDGSYTAGGKPLVCFHWSGYRPDLPHQLTSYESGSTIPPGTVLEELSRDYRQSLARYVGALRGKKYRYPYNHLSDGTPILPVWREAVRRRRKQLDIPGDPFHATPGWLEQLRRVGNKQHFSRNDWILAEARKLHEGVFFRLLRRIKAI